MEYVPYDIDCAIFQAMQSPRPAGSVHTDTEFAFGDSLGMDLNQILDMKSTDFAMTMNSKGVQFNHPFSPIAVNYTVSLPMDERKLRRPGPLFPPVVAQSITTQEMVRCDATLQAATSLCTVRTDDADYYAWDYKEQEQIQQIQPEQDRELEEDGTFPLPLSPETPMTPIPDPYMVTECDTNYNTSTTIEGQERDTDHSHHAVSTLNAVTNNGSIHVHCDTLTLPVRGKNGNLHSGILRMDSISEINQTVSLSETSLNTNYSKSINSSKTDSLENNLSEQLIDLYIEQRQSLNASVHFDKIAVTASNQKTILLSSKGLKQGIHEWHIELWSVDVDLQEIGVIGTDDIDRIPVSDFGAMDTARFKSRAVYGNEIGTGKLYYGSLDEDGKARCMRDLRSFFKTGWTVGSVITVKLDLNKWRIKFLLNGESVRYTMSLEPKKEYFPMISFSGNCKYFLH